MLAGVARADDPPIVLEDVEPARTPDGKLIFTPDDDDELIIVEEEEKPLAPAPPRVSGALGRLWEAWHIAAEPELYAAGQLIDPADGSWRLLGSLWAESWLRPAPNLSFYGTAVARVAVDNTPGGRLYPWADLYELYARITVDRATVQLGRLVVPWGRTRVAALGDRLNPSDFRRGAPFPEPARQRQPQLGALAKGSLGILGLQAVLFVAHEPSEGSLAAANQGGVRTARYQTALVRSPHRALGLLAEADTNALRAAYTLGTPTLAGRATTRVGEIDLNASVVWGFDETPSLRLGPEVRRALVAEALPFIGDPSPVALPCGVDVTLRCLGGHDALSYSRSTSIALDASWGLGLVVVRAEARATPHLSGFGGKTAWVLDPAGLRSIQVSQYAAAVSVEGQLGDAVDGSFELFNVMWDGVPDNTRLWGVERLEARALPTRMVHRLAAGARLGGALLSDKVRWKIGGEAGVLQPDVLVSAEMRYRLPLLGLYVGGRGDLFTGIPGSPGWMRQDASQLGVFVGEGGG